MNGKNVVVLISCMIVIGIVSVGFTINMTNGTITSGLFAKASAQQQSSNYTLSTNSIPNWFRNATKWWSEGQTSDSDFLNAMKYLIDNGIIRISQTSSLPLIASQNSTMVQKIDDLQTRYDALQMKYNELLTQTQNVPGNQIANSNNYAESISAVAVYPIVQSDGFFQTTAYNGTILKITVNIRDGTGLVLANTAIPEGVDFQNSARVAVQVAHNITGIDLSNKDVIFSITANDQNLQAVDGGSAGGAMTVLLTSAILGKSINGHVLMTGTIQPDGTIGPIGGVLEKAQAAANYGAKIFLVPSGQGVVEEQHCTQSTQGPFVYQSCSPQDVSLTSIMESKYGMKVIEVGDINDVLKYFNSSQ
ncbi:MAG: S16 family serine protease [Nitrosotalea sp.]